MNFETTSPSLQSCSRFFQPEYDAVNESTKEVIYTVYAAPQRYNESLEMQFLGLQRFAIVWGQDFDYRIFEIIERALVADLLSPISMLYLNQHKLTIVGTPPPRLCALGGEIFFQSRWEEAATDQWIIWEVELVTPTNLDALAPDNPIRCYGKSIIENEKFGVFSYEDSMFAFGDVTPELSP